MCCGHLRSAALAEVKVHCHIRILQQKTIYLQIGHIFHTLIHSGLQYLLSALQVQ